jgi:predicted nucleotidyltransferase
MSEAMLELAADILGPLVEDVVFVGGATVHLWLTEEAAPPVRATDDVDVICNVASYGEYQLLAERLRERGLHEAADEPVICRWRHRESGLAIDVMPTSEKVLGFSNRWYDLAIETAVERELGSGVGIRAVSPPVVIATKLAAWRGRGNDDVL